MIDFDALDAHVAEGFATPERRLAVLSNVVDSEAVRLQRIVRFCAQHTLVADALEAGEITVDHADVLRAAAVSVGAELFNDDVLDLLRAANGVDFSVFNDRITDWTWRKTPEATEDGIEKQFNNRYLSMRGDIFGGVKGSFKLDAAGAAVVAEALETTPDPANSVAPQRTAGQRRADRLVELAELANSSTTPDPDSGVDGSEPTGARRTGSSVDVVIDLPTLLGFPFDLDNHRNDSGEVDWNSIQQSFTATGSAPRPVLAQFFCDASYRQLITSGPRIVLATTKPPPTSPVRYAGPSNAETGAANSPAVTANGNGAMSTTSCQSSKVGRRMNRIWRWCAGPTARSFIKAGGN